MRGSPIRAAFGWALLQETRLAIEQKFNSGSRDVPHILRTELQNLLGKFHLSIETFLPVILDNYALIDRDFMSRSVEPLMTVNPLWRKESDDPNALQEIGILLETQTIGCGTAMLPFARVWWPLTTAHVSRSLNVSPVFMLSRAINLIKIIFRLFWEYNDCLISE